MDDECNASKTPEEYGIIDEKLRHETALSRHIGSLLTDDFHSDLIVKVENEKFSVHKIILATRCDYFRALLFGGMRESKQDEIEIVDCTAEVFKIILEYVYTGCMPLLSLTHNTILDVLITTHKYGIGDLEEAIAMYLKQTLVMENYYSVYETAGIYNLKILQEVLISLFDEHASQILSQDWFLQVPLDFVENLLKRDTFFAPEENILEKVCCWIHANDGISMKRRIELLKHVQLPITKIKTSILTSKVNGYSVNAILNAMDEFSRNWESNVGHRGILRKEQNMATSKMGTFLLRANEKNPSNLFNESASNLYYDSYSGYTSHIISNFHNTSGIVIQLGTQCVVNHIKMLLWDKNSRSYFYYVEVSVDREKWVRIIDHTEYFCRSWQHLSFPRCVVKYIRVVGTHNTDNDYFHIVHFEIKYTDKIPLLEGGIVVPTCNVATCAFGATVAKGSSKCENSLLDGNFLSYNASDGVTYHYLDEDCIEIQLGQPYAVDSMRFLLLDCDQRYYSYFVEVSVNMEEWEVLVDKSNETCTSWQTLCFKRRPIVFIRITGTRSTTNVFQMVHFECPAAQNILHRTC